MAINRTDNGARLANAILFPVVGLVLLAIAFSVALIAYTSQSADHAAMDSERRLLRGSTDLQLALLAKEQEGAAVWDLADYYTRPSSVNTQWLDANLGHWLYANHGHDQTVIVGETGEAIYNAVKGQQISPRESQALISGIWPLIARTRAKFINKFKPLPSGLFVIERPLNGFTRSIHETGFALHEGDLAFVSVTAISPELKQFVANRRPPAVLVSVKKLEDTRLSALAARSGVSDLRTRPASAKAEAAATFDLTSPLGAPIGSLAWTANKPGSRILSGVSPVLFLLAALIAGLTGVVLFYTRHNTRRLAESEARAQHAALHDSLTGLSNRDFFADRFRRELANWDARKGLIGVIYIDLDHFKDINDTLGHAAGDEVIREAARRLRVLVPDDATLARISGDEFALLLPGYASRASIEHMLRRIQDRFAIPMYVSGTHLHVSLSVGAAIAPEDSLSMGELLRKADIALYSAKRGGRGRWAFFDISMEEHVRTRENLAHALRDAIGKDLLHVVYQPQTTIDGATVLSVEALLRWTDPEMGPVSPSIFVPIAEEIGLINELGLYVLRKACEDAAAWPHLGLAVNVSPSQFRHPRFIDDLRETLEACNFEPSRLEIEVTETVFADNDCNILSTLKQVQEMGVRVALDDFGIGYSSLSYLRRFPFDTLKIDRSFIADLDVAPHAHSILSTIIDLGDALGMKVVAEGIETRQQASILQRTNCDRLQGFYLSRPVAPDNVPATEARLAADREPAAAISLSA
ncbi:EAL domain-containing protein [Stappia sp. ES.058]|uniref:bifunctional diguanylate cyclase/phosphodiesterase n=1 Tax=Stappia sp. ES.058 TaxID=1881061 RepID=UPI000879CEE3|nr:EAL domain-containing protein [Stappia sp. ES.058]SDU22415.1 periplasmic sensor diguanylate cyclase/phosphodiesterase [Stappia sp. ES.058]